MSNIGSAVPFIAQHKVAFAVTAIVLLTAVNLRGIRESGTAFAIPTYAFMAGMFGMAPPLLAQAPRLVEAFRVGGGVPFGDFAPECRAAIDVMNRGNYAQRLVDYWLAQVPGLAARLTQGGRVLDVGCGHGHAALAIAKGFPASEVVGVDPDAASIAEAEAAARAAGAGNLRFVRAFLDGIPEQPGFDLGAGAQDRDARRLGGEVRPGLGDVGGGDEDGD
jgi:hypothetical protein